MITKEEIQKLATLSQLKLSDGEIDALTGEFGAILGYVAELNTLARDTPPAAKEAVRNVFRDDTVPHEKGIYTDALLKEAAEKEGKYIQVKKIL